MTADQSRLYGPPWARGSGLGSRHLGWLAVVVLALLQLPALWVAVHGKELLEIAAAVLALVSTAALLWRRHIPGPVLVVVAALCLPGIALGGGPPLPAVPVAFALGSAVFRGRRIWAWSTLAALATVGASGLILVTGVPWGVGRLLVVTLALCLIAALAEGARGRRDRYRAMAQDVATRRRSAVEVERLHIARELHDILAHSLSEISVQAGVGLHLFEAQPELAKEALKSIRATSGTALDEVRSVLGVLREGAEPVSHSPEPTLMRLPELVDAARRQGVAVALENRLDEGRAAQITARVQSAMYRIVQEALTNIAKHGAAGEARVVVAATDRGYTLEVSNPGARGDAPARGDGSGSGQEQHVQRGLIGIRERVALLGGTVRAGPNPSGGWTVSVRIPIANGRRE